MTPFIQHTGITAPLVRDNINTDTIIPSREMRSVSRSGLSEGLFAPWRYDDPNARTLNSAFVLNEAGFSGASILLTGANFGCGSSREHAVWALLESGFRVIMATSFATIFRNNALRNGLLTIELHPDRIERLAEWVSRDPQAHTLGSSWYDKAHLLKGKTAGWTKEDHEKAGFRMVPNSPEPLTRVSPPISIR